jgi:hexosaminidase
VADSVAKPRITIVPGAEHTLTATLDCELPDVAIHYTLDGSAPDATSPRYTAPLDIANDCILRCVGVDTNGRVYGDERQHLWLHRALHAPVYHWRNEAMQPAPEYERLTNGCLGRERIFHASEWTAFADRDTDLVVDLQEVQDVNGLRLNFEAGAHRQLFFPSGLHAWLSLDGHSWESWFAMDDERLAGGSLALDSEPCRARFLRLQLQNHDLHYGPEQRAHITRPVHIDEIVVI